VKTYVDAFFRLIRGLLVRSSRGAKSIASKTENRSANEVAVKLKLNAQICEALPDLHEVLNITASAIAGRKPTGRTGDCLVDRPDLPENSIEVDLQRLESPTLYVRHRRFYAEAFFESPVRGRTKTKSGPTDTVCIAVTNTGTTGPTSQGCSFAKNSQKLIDFAFSFWFTPPPKQLKQ